jgi:hypothetical protein
MYIYYCFSAIFLALPQNYTTRYLYHPPPQSKKFTFVGASKCLSYLEGFTGLLQLPLTKTGIEENSFFLEVTPCVLVSSVRQFKKYRDAFTFMLDPADEGITNL